MKKLLLCGAVAFAAFSCEKTYQCECTHVMNGEDWKPIITNVAIEENKKDAETECKSLEYSYGWQDYQNCKIK